MVEQWERTSIGMVARQTGLETHTIRHCVRVGLVSESLTKDDLAELRRVRRLVDLEVNLAGVEIIVRMRRRIVALQAEIAQLQNSITELERKTDQLDTG